MNISQNRPKIADTSRLNMGNSDTSVEMDIVINQIVLKLADTSRLKY